MLAVTGGRLGPARHRLGQHHAARAEAGARPRHLEPRAQRKRRQHDHEQAGIDETEFQPYGPVRVQVADPDGYRVEVYAF